MFSLKKSLSNQKGSYKPFILGFFAVGALSVTTFYELSTYDEDVQELTNEVLQKDSQTITSTTTGSDTNTNFPNIVEKEDFVLKPENPTHYIPTFIMQNDHIEIEGESMKIITNFDAKVFFTTALEKANSISNVMVTELESIESQSYKTQSMVLSQYNIDYDNLLLKKTVQEKIGETEPVEKEALYANEDGLHYDFGKELPQAPKDNVSFGEGELTKENLLDKATLFDYQKSPYHLVKEFHSNTFSVSDYIIATNDTTTVLFKETEETQGGTTHFELEAFWFDMKTALPSRAIKYTTTVIDGAHDYKLEEYVYDDWNQASTIELPKNFYQTNP